MKFGISVGTGRFSLLLPSDESDVLFFDRLDPSNRKHVYPVRIIIKETPSNWSQATAILDTIKVKNGTDSVDTVSGAVTAGDLAEVGGLVFLAAGQYQNTNTRLRRARLGAAH